MSTWMALGERVWQASWQGALVLGAIALVCAGLGRRPRLRRALWALGALRMLVGLVALVPIALPLLPAQATLAAANAPVTTASTAAQVMTNIPAMEKANTPVTTANTATQVMANMPAMAKANMPAIEAGTPAGASAMATRGLMTRLRGWIAEYGAVPLAFALLGLAWAAAMAAQLIRLARQLGNAARLRRQARPVTDERVRAAFFALCQRAGLGAPPALASSDTIVTPLALGALAPMVLVPANFASLSPGEQQMALAHELGHVQCGDLWLGWVPALARMLFFFHPLARLAEREYLLAREQACDARALDLTDAAPADYGRLLLRFGVVGRHVMPAAASPHVSALKRRLVMLKNRSGSRVRESRLRRAGAATLVTLATLGAACSWKVVAKESPASREVTAPATATAAVAPAPSDEVPPAGDAPAPKRAGSHRPDARRLAFRFVDGDRSVSQSSRHDLPNGLSARFGAHFIWAKLDERAYVIKDAAVLARLRAMFDTIDKLGRDQSVLGDLQNRLGDQQNVLGDQQNVLGREQSALGERISALDDEMERLAGQKARLAAQPAGGDGERVLERQLAELQRQQDELHERQSSANAKQVAINAEQVKLNRQQVAYNRQQVALNRQQQAMQRDLDPEVRVIVENAVERGLAEPTTP